MHVVRVKISNILGIEHLDFEPGKITEISGPNGSGKTSVLETIQAVLKGGNDATLLRQGAEKGEAVLILDDGTEITRTVTPLKSDTSIRRDGKKQARPADILRNLTDLYSANPVEFLRARKQDRVKVLMETMPLVVDKAVVEKIIEHPLDVVPNAHALDVINGLYTGFYDERTGVNRVVDEKTKSIKQMKEALPDAPAGIEGDEDTIRTRIKTADDVLVAERKRIEDKLTGLKTTWATEENNIKTELAAAIVKLQTEAQEKIQAIHATANKVEVAASKQSELALSRHTEEVTPLKVALQAVTSNRDLHAKRTQTLALIATMESDLEKEQDASLRLDRIMANLEGYKATLLASLPIPGLEVIQGEIFRDGVAFDRLNTAQQVNIAVEIAKLRTGTLGCCCVDGLELLDPAAYEEFKTQAIESGLQMFISKVTGDEFTVNTHGDIA